MKEAESDTQGWGGALWLDVQGEGREVVRERSPKGNREGRKGYRFISKFIFFFIIIPVVSHEAPFKEEYILCQNPNKRHDINNPVLCP